MTIHFLAYSSELDTVKKAGAAVISPEHTATPTLYRNFLKRIVDIVLILMAAPIVLPLLLVCTVLVSMDGRNPFYSQMRVGRHGNPFRIWKLRTMVHNADALLEVYLSHNPEARLEWENTQKLKNDPRITFFGKFLRKTSIDELPQLLNVLNGTMSLVGPRPMMVCQRASYPGTKYFELRPGITGMWQVSDRNHCEFQDRARYDDRYFETVSFGTDARILLQTVGVVLKATGY
ncbi:MAG: sugar transferase [Tateyamaria sp.]|uniref:sugar transferase n=1 Tax=Tateyamaria sp. TaxID=1929288 RepID=UPI00329F6FDA